VFADSSGQARTAFSQPRELIRARRRGNSFDDARKESVNSLGSEPVGEFVGVGVEPINGELGGRQIGEDWEEVEVRDAQVPPELAQFFVDKLPWVTRSQGLEERERDDR
jgi:hypothetical protein